LDRGLYQHDINKMYEEQANESLKNKLIDAKSKQEAQKN